MQELLAEVPNAVDDAGWVKVTLAIIAIGGVPFATFCAIMLEWIRRKLNLAASAALTAVDTAVETRGMINGRLQELLQQAVEKAYMEGAASVAKKMMQNPKISVEAKEATQAMADTMSEAKEVGREASRPKPPSDFPPKCKNPRPT